MGSTNKPAELRNPQPERILITGKPGEGKTQFLRSLISLLEEDHTPYTAVIAEGVFAGSKRQHFSLRLLPDDQLLPLCSRERMPGWFSWRDWWFNPEAFRAGSTHLYQGLERAHILVLDEVGQLELQGQGWAEVLAAMLPRSNALIISGREDFTGRITARWPADWHILRPDAGPAALAKILRQNRQEGK